MEKGDKNVTAFGKARKTLIILIWAVISWFPLMYLRYCAVYGDSDIEIPFFEISGNPFTEAAAAVFLIAAFTAIIILPIAFSVNLSRKGNRDMAVILFLIMLAIWKYPVRNYARLAYLKDNIEVFNSAVSYVLEEAGERRKNMQIIAIPEEYGVTTYWSGYEGNPDYVYFMKDKNTIKIFFYKAGLIYEKGYLYAINLPECSEPYKKSMVLFGADIKSDNGGVWDWAEYDRADLPNYNDRNWR